MDENTKRLIGNHPHGINPPLLGIYPHTKPALYPNMYKC